MTGPAARPGRDAFSERRKCLQRLLVLPGSLLFHEQSSAGGQLEEPLADSVRSALSSAIANSAPPVPTFATTDGLNELGLGPQGLTGNNSVMGVNIESSARHPSTIGVAVSTGCWAHRRGRIRINADMSYEVISHQGFKL